MLRRLKSFLLTLLSAMLLELSFPQVEWTPLAWIALVPLLCVLDGKKPWKAFGIAYLCGFIFFLMTLGWFVYVTYPGAFLLIAYVSVYFATFGFFFVYFQRLPLVPRIFVLSAVWIVLEFIRASLFGGFGWVMLGHSQYKNILLIQIADITGVYGVSFLVILVNLLLFETIKSVKYSGANGTQDIKLAQMLVVGLLLAVLGYGAWEAKNIPNYTTVKVGVVQPNIPQEIKWDSVLQPEIVAKTMRLSNSLQEEKPDLIVWPETSLPGVTTEVPYLLDRIEESARRIKIPLLIGAIAQDKSYYYNSAILISSEGQIQDRYDKIHLVPFGEFLPLRPVLGWINHFVPIEDFTSGRSYKILPAGSSQKKFGVLICFEDTVSDLRRHFVKSGAQFFVNMTNDAWFKDTKAPFLHLQAALLGCVENKRSLVRAANTGVSTFIDPWGRILQSVHNDQGKKTFVEGTAIAVLPLMNNQTFYTKFGDIFTYLCFACILWGIGI